MNKTLQILVLFILATGIFIFLNWFNDEERHKDVGLWAYIPYENFWAVDVENDVISNTNNSFRKGQPCVLEFGGKVAVIKVSAAGRYTLLYEGPDGKNGSGSICGNGTLYNMVGRPNLEQMTKNYLETLEATREEIGNIIGALNSAPVDKPFAVKKDTYVVIKNPDGIKNHSGYREFNKACLIRAGGRLIPLGTVETRGGVRVLHEYWNPGNHQSVGTQCGNGTLLYY